MVESIRDVATGVSSPPSSAAKHRPRGGAAPATGFASTICELKTSERSFPERVSPARLLGAGAARSAIIAEAVASPDGQDLNDAAAIEIALSLKLRAISRRSSSSARRQRLATQRHRSGHCSGPDPGEWDEERLGQVVDN
jgi:hypothetical protein